MFSPGAGPRGSTLQQPQGSNFMFELLCDRGLMRRAVANRSDVAMVTEASPGDVRSVCLIFRKAEPAAVLKMQDEQESSAMADEHTPEIKTVCPVCRRPMALLHEIRRCTCSSASPADSR